MDPAVPAIAGTAVQVHTQELNPTFGKSQKPPAYNGSADKAWKVDYGSKVPPAGEKKKSEEPSKTPK